MNTIVVDPVQHLQSGLWVRPDVGDQIGDEHVVNEQNAYKLLPIHEEDTVLDVGAHIGAFTCLIALSRGASSVIAVEPDPCSVELLRKNIDGDPRVSVLEGAVVDGDVEEVDLYLGKRMTTMHTLVPTRGREVLRVPAFNFSKLLEEYRPDVIKMDIEGGEFSLTGLFELPAFVKAIAIEIHPYKGDRTRELSRNLVTSLEQQFIPLRPAVVRDKGWITQGVYARGGRELS